MDEYDAYYHNETAEYIYNLVREFDNLQAVLTTHNTVLMSNDNTRPDTCFVISDNKEIKSLFELTTKEIRVAHNLEKIYRNGGFVG